MDTLLECLLATEKPVYGDSKPSGRKIGIIHTETEGCGNFTKA
jgi:hypothetical protein